jgi:hypothetical protein
MLTWRVAPGMYNGCVGAELCEFPLVSPVSLYSELSGAKVLTWCVVGGMLNGRLGAVIREFPPVSPVRLIRARSAGRESMFA